MCDEREHYDAGRVPVQVEIDRDSNVLTLKVDGATVAAVKGVLSAGVLFDVSDGRSGWVVEPTKKVVARRRNERASARFIRQHPFSYVSGVHPGGWTWSVKEEEAIELTPLQQAELKRHCARHMTIDFVEVDK